VGDPNVAIGDAELNRIGEYVQTHLPEWMEKLGVLPARDPVTNTQLLERVVRLDERVVRVEEELKAQREIMTVRFSAMDDRFAAQAKSIDDRFAAQAKTMDDRFAALTQNINVVKWFVVTSFVVLGAAISLLAVLS
jgi:hypothetical protein